MSYQAYPDWTVNIVYSKGQIVVGSNARLYKALLHHKATLASDSHPVSGANWASYWVATSPSVPRTRKQNGGIEMQQMVSNEGKRSAAPTMDAVMSKFPYRR